MSISKQLRASLLLIFLVISVGSVAVSPVAAQSSGQIPSGVSGLNFSTVVAEGSPDFTGFTRDNEVRPGETSEVVVHLINQGDVEEGGLPQLEKRVTAAKSLRITIDDSGVPLEVDRDDFAAGALPVGEQVPVPLKISADSDVNPGTYTLDLKLEYSYTSKAKITDDGVTYTESSGSDTLEVDVEVSDGPIFEVVGMSSNVAVGSSGVLELEIENTGSETAHESTVVIGTGGGTLNVGGSGGLGGAGSSMPSSSGSISMSQLPSGMSSSALASQLGSSGSSSSTESDSPDVTVAGGKQTESFAGTWESGETKTVRSKISVSDDAILRNYVLKSKVKYTDPDGESQVSDALVTGFKPDPEQSFEITDVSQNLEVGMYGTLSGEVVNTGGSAVSNAKVVLKTDDSPMVNTRRTEYPVGEVGPGESKSFEFDIGINGEASEGPRQFSFVTKYEDASGDSHESKSMDVLVEVSGKGSTFDVETQNATLTPGSRKMVEIEVTNQANQVMSSILPKVVSNGPLTVYNDDAFISELGPGESETVTVGVEAPGSATQKTYPLSVDMRYQNERGDSKISDRYHVPVNVEGGSDSSVLGSLLPFAGDIPPLLPATLLFTAVTGFIISKTGVGPEIVGRIKEALPLGRVGEAVNDDDLLSLKNDIDSDD